MATRPAVLVTGADQHQGLAVIRGLGLAGIRVVACGVERRSIGFYSRFAAATARYTSPFASRQDFVADILRIVRQTGASLIIPTVESTMVVLNEWRHVVEPSAALAAPRPDVFEYAIDKGKTLGLAERLQVPTPRTVQGATTGEILARAGELRFPVAIKPRGHGLHLATANTLGFKVRYARTADELGERLQPFERDAKALLVQEYVPGVGRCVAAVCRQGEPLALFAYARDRELPLSGGVSVVRRSIPLDERLESYTAALLREVGWHGVAMVEFKYDLQADRYTLMEINGRFQASTALSLDAGLNLPRLVAALYGIGRTGPIPPYRVGVEERWLRGDVLALRDALIGRHAPTAAPAGSLPLRRRVLWHFARDFRPGMRYDEFKWYDPKPGVAEGLGLIAMTLGWLFGWVRRIGGYRPLRRRASTLTSSMAHRSIRA
ncbi:MAG TPA: ATP-grasp domain-containing protein [Gemmatimonadales bacterium]|nr:ATP-grasp domain-containing protein [Gemmatimonadales bacterium]